MNLQNVKKNSNNYGRFDVGPATSWVSYLLAGSVEYDSMFLFNENLDNFYFWEISSIRQIIIKIYWKMTVFLRNILYRLNISAVVLRAQYSHDISYRYSN